METPDLVLVTKADLGQPARRAAADAIGALSLAAADRPPPPVLLVSAEKGEGVSEALLAIDAAVADAAARAQAAAGEPRALAQARNYLRQSIAAAFGETGWRRAQAALARTAPFGSPPAPFATGHMLLTQLRLALDAGLADLDPPLGFR